MSSGGLRERKKAATKVALSLAAQALMLERGLDTVNGDAIATAAGVAPRTFRNYFSSKEDAVLFALESVQDRYVETFLLRDPSEAVLDSLEAAAIGLIDATESLEQLIVATRLIARHPALILHRAASRGQAGATLLREVGRRTGTDPDCDAHPRLVVRAAEAVVLTVTEMHAGRHVERAQLIDLVQQGFDQLRRGLAGLEAAGPTSRAEHAP